MLLLEKKTRVAPSLVSRRTVCLHSDPHTTREGNAGIGVSLSTLRMFTARIVWRWGATPLLAPLLPVTSRLASFTHGREKQFCSVASTEQNDTSLVDVEARVNVVVNDLSVRGITQYPKAQVMCLYQLLLDLDIKAETIEAQLLQMPHLLCHSHKAWTNTCEVMVENGIPGLRILQSIALYPKFLKIKSSLLQDKLLLYRQMNVGKLNCLSLVIKYPVLLLGEPSHLKNRLDSLYALFPPASLKNLIQNNPNVLLDSWEDIMAKIMYIHEEMGLEQPHIGAARCLKQSLLHIKTRHLFLLRAGLYKTPDLKKDKQSHRRNPSLTDIIDTSDKRFTNRIARLTEQEYGVFKAMMAAEEQDSKDYDSDDGEEEE
ncbi:uncharacterized protein LOC123518816 [Portunus trituberculatus]|uniref:uncharacterized protein LOC123518816 n=1 Tax=Portunus trituberculatus TaxID=210409 RepID=UPI001E1D0995|nr:uncharacterized protein LOC123518816 [Portunus trituberculatus]